MFKLKCANSCKSWQIANNCIFIIKSLKNKNVFFRLFWTTEPGEPSWPQIEAPLFPWSVPWRRLWCLIGAGRDSRSQRCSGVCDGAFTPVTCHTHGSDKSYGKTWNPRCLSPLSPSNIAGMSFHQRRRGEKKRINRGIKKAVGRVTALCGGVSALVSLWVKIDQFADRAGGCVISNIGFAPH